MHAVFLPNLNCDISRKFGWEATIHGLRIIYSKRTSSIKIDAQPGFPQLVNYKQLWWMLDERVRYPYMWWLYRPRDNFNATLRSVICYSILNIISRWRCHISSQLLKMLIFRTFQCDGKSPQPASWPFGGTIGIWFSRRQFDEVTRKWFGSIDGLRWMDGNWGYIQYLISMKIIFISPWK